MAKNLNSIQWLNRAVSKDQTRINLTSAWRASTDMVGTDGHRMHRLLGLPAVEKPVSADPGSTVTDFPDYTIALPAKAPTCSFEMNATTFPIERLKAFHKLLGKSSPYVLLSVQGDRISLSVDKNEPDYGIMQVKLETRLIDAPKGSGKVWLSLAYLIDAVDGLMMWRVSLHGELSAFTIDSTIDGLDVQALIMPVTAPN